MTFVKSINHQSVIDTLMTGGVVVLRTDTLYGLLAKADDAQAVERVYRLKSRDNSKSPVVLIADCDQMFDRLPFEVDYLASQPWPERTTIVLPSQLAPDWIARNNQSVAYRQPSVSDLQQLLWQTGPLIAPSANPEGERPAMTAEQARQYFGDAVDVYVDSGTVDDGRPSQILRLLDDGSMERLR